MTSKSKPTKTQQELADLRKPWINLRQAIRLVALISILLAVWVTAQLSQQSSLSLETILWGLGFGVSIWIVAGLVYLLTSWMRRKQ